MDEFLRRHWNDPGVRADVARLGSEHAAEAADPTLPRWKDDPGDVAAYLHWLMDRDRKSTPLKSLQGRIWNEGYRTGELRGEVYPDVAPAMERWQREGIAVAIFSSGSVQAQRLLFQSTPAGDLTGFLSGYFDTTTGPKTSAESYRRIAEALDRRPDEVLFVSDVEKELDAALEAGMQTALCVRSGPAPSGAPHPVINQFDELRSRS